VGKPYIFSTSLTYRINISLSTFILSFASVNSFQQLIQIENVRGIDQTKEIKDTQSHKGVF